MPFGDSTYPISVVVTVNAHGVATCTCAPTTATLSTAPNVTLAYALTAPPGWVFQPSGAVVVANPANQFPEASVTSGDGQSATLLDLNTDSSTYNYTVYVTNTATGETARHDPAIKNGGNPGT